MRRTQRFDTLDGLRERVRDEFGESARVIGVERVSKGGLAAVLGRGGQTPYYEATIEVPDAIGPDGAAAELELTVADRVGIAALLADANAADEAPLSRADDAAATSAEFDALISQLREHAGLGAEPAESPLAPRHSSAAHPAEALQFPVIPDAGVPGEVPTGSRAAPEPPVPRVASEAGDLVLVAGYPEAVGAGAARLAAGLRARLHPAGRLQLAGADPIDSRRSAIAARWNAVNDDAIVVVALGLEPGDPVEELVRAINPDQIWLHLAAGSRPADARALMAPLAAASSVTALSVFGVSRTLDPAALNALGVPVGLVDGEPAARSTF